MERIKKKTGIILLLVLSCVCLIIVNGYLHSAKVNIRKYCTEDLALRNVSVNLESMYRYEGYNFHKLRIKCDGFSEIDSENLFSIFSKLSYICHKYEKYTSEDNISIESDGHLYTYRDDTLDTQNTYEILCDNTVIAVRNSVDEPIKESNNKTDTDDIYGHTKYDVIVIAKKTVKEQLKAPSTAKFCKSTDYDVSRSGTVWTVSGFVDAENSFGVSLRSNFSVTINFSSRDYYTIDSCNIY